MPVLVCLALCSLSQTIGDRRMRVDIAGGKDRDRGGAGGRGGGSGGGGGDRRGGSDSSYRDYRSGSGGGGRDRGQSLELNETF